MEVPGPAVAVSFLIMFGGSQLYFPNNPGGRSAAEALIGADRLRALGQRMRDHKAEVPMPRSWLIRALHAEGLNVRQICRTLKTTSRNVQATLRKARQT